MRQSCGETTIRRIIADGTKKAAIPEEAAFL